MLGRFQSFWGSGLECMPSFNQKPSMNHVWTILISLLLLISIGAYSQAQVNYQVYEDSIIDQSNLAVKGETEKERSDASAKLIQLLIPILKQKDSFTYPFESVKSMAIVGSPDNTFRLFNWNEPQEDGTYKYYCIVQTFNKKTKEARVFQLNDDQRNNNDRLAIEKKKLKYPHWYGALYYQIIYNKSKGNKYYTLLGWEGKDQLTTCKIIEAIKFNKKGEPEFGASVFSKSSSRIIFEYSNQASMSLKYDEKRKQIIYDHLAPSSPEYMSKFMFYGPDMSYDALVFKKGKWVLMEKVEPKNDKND